MTTFNDRTPAKAACGNFSLPWMSEIPSAATVYPPLCDSLPSFLWRAGRARRREAADAGRPAVWLRRAERRLRQHDGRRDHRPAQGDADGAAGRRRSVYHLKLQFSYTFWHL
jgi:hypothetical protein